MLKRLLALVTMVLFIAGMNAGVAYAKPGKEQDKPEKPKAAEERFKLEVKDGKIEIKDGEVVFEIRDGKIEYKSANGKLELGRNGLEMKGDVLAELRAKLAAYDAIIKAGIELGGFSDTRYHWAKESIEKLAALGVVNGYEDGRFRPESPVTQAEAVSLVMSIAVDDGNAVDEDEDETDESAGEDEAAEEDEDVDEEDLEGVPAWAKGQVKKAAMKGVINLNRFHSHVQASRAQVAVAVAKALNLDISGIDVSNVPFKDGLLISPEDLPYLIAMYNAGYIKGAPNGNFNPNSSITRAELAAILSRIIDDRAGENGGDDTDQNAGDDAEQDPGDGNDESSEEDAGGDTGGE
ncbi:MAG: S-layer homology domain-containing protein [Bacillota bacterium]